MFRHLSSIVFFGGLALTAGALWKFSESKWGRTELYAVTGLDQRKFGGETEVPMLKLAPIKGERRQPMQVEKEVYDAVRGTDQVQIRTRIIPLLGGELIQFSLLRSGTAVREWNEGWPFFGFAMFVASFAGAGLFFALYRFIVAVFRLKPPTED